MKLLKKECVANRGSKAKANKMSSHYYSSASARVGRQ